MSEQDNIYSLAWGSERLALVKQEIAKLLVGQEQVVDQVLITLVSGGHVLIEGVPGLGKTLLVNCLAKCFGGKATRIQFTPDLMPSDVTGHAIYDMNANKFNIRKGPVFTNLLLADEINRAPAKTQAALLEVMQERQVTIEGNTFPAPAPFMVLATQNPIEHEGTYPLPEAELDRFLMKIYVDYPQELDEQALVKLNIAPKLAQTSPQQVSRVISVEEVTALQQLAAQLTVDDQLIEYAVRIVRTTRSWAGIARGAGPRGSINIVMAARAKALLEGREFVTPDDIKTVAVPVLRHRILLTPEMEIEGFHPDTVLQQLLQQVEAPRS